jgi:hypothetical protein
LSAFGSSDREGGTIERYMDVPLARHASAERRDSTVILWGKALTGAERATARRCRWPGSIAGVGSASFWAGLGPLFARLGWDRLRAGAA